MVENKGSLFGIIAIIIGASGLGLGAFSFVNFQVVEGPEGIPGDDGTDGVDGMDGEDAPGGLIIGILEPDHGETIQGVIIIRAIIYGTWNYSVSVLRDGTEIGTSLPLVWDTTLESKGWYNITVKITDIESNNSTSDEAIVYVDNSLAPGYNWTIYWSETSPFSWIGLTTTWHNVFEDTGSFSVNIYVEPGESVHLTFTCYVYGIPDTDFYYAFFDNPGQISESQIGLVTRVTHTSDYDTFHFERIVDLSTGSHNIGIQVRTVSGTGSIFFDNRLLIIQTLVGTIPF